MKLARRSGIALAVASSALVIAASAPHAFSPGYTYRLKISGQITEANGKSKDYVVMSGKAMVNANGGRLDIDEASKERGAMTEKGGYILFDPTAMMIVSPKDKQILRFGVDDMEKSMSALTGNVPGMSIKISDVAVNFEKLGAGEPLLGMATTRYRITQDYKIAMKVAFMNRSSTEHIVQEYWMADQKKGFANPFGRMAGMRPVGGGAFSELITKTSEATARMGKGIALKTVSTTTSTNNKNEATTNVSTMEVTELQAGNVDDALLKAPADYKVVDLGEQTKAMAKQLEEAKATQDAQAAQAGQAPGQVDAAAAAPDSSPSLKAAAAEAAKEAAKQKAGDKIKKGFGGLLRRP
jgi:hypothetical protein